ncbi:MAG: DUF2163 domain-containing protein [Sandarakinorhabdus sp.]|nr:DUF2163 domain-containing protein [Sandarakinorhabdus sp.]
MNTALGPALGADLTRLAICWRIVREDGIALGFTTHDRPLAIAGLRYESAPGMAPSAIVATDSIEIDTMEVAGALTAGAMTAADLGAGRFDGASVRLFMVDWQNPAGGQHLLAAGKFGTIQVGTGPDVGFSATLQGPTAALAHLHIETFSPECRAELGDRRCRVAMRGRIIRSRVQSADGEHAAVDAIDAASAADYVAGAIRVLDGPLAGIDRRIIAVSGSALSLDEPLAIAVGTLVEVRQGCDKQFATCVDRFENAVNFRGEPHIPGGDVLMRFGGL